MLIDDETIEMVDKVQTISGGFGIANKHRLAMVHDGGVVSTVTIQVLWKS